MVTTIQIDEKIKDKLDKLKIHHRETYNELISRLITSPISNSKVDKESLIETIEVLSDPETMEGIVKIATSRGVKISTFWLGGAHELAREHAIRLAMVSGQTGGVFMDANALTKRCNKPQA